MTFSFGFDNKSMALSYLNTSVTGRNVIEKRQSNRLKHSQLSKTNNINTLEKKLIRDLLYESKPWKSVELQIHRSFDEIQRQSVKEISTKRSLFSLAKIKTNISIKPIEKSFLLDNINDNHIYSDRKKLLVNQYPHSVNKPVDEGDGDCLNSLDDPIYQMIHINNNQINQSTDFISLDDIKLLLKYSNVSSDVYVTTRLVYFLVLSYVHILILIQSDSSGDNLTNYLSNNLSNYLSTQLSQYLITELIEVYTWDKFIKLLSYKKIFIELLLDIERGGPAIGDSLFYSHISNSYIAVLRNLIKSNIFLLTNYPTGKSPVTNILKKLNVWLTVVVGKIYSHSRSIDSFSSRPMSPQLEDSPRPNSSHSSNSLPVGSSHITDDKNPSRSSFLMILDDKQNDYRGALLQTLTFVRSTDCLDVLLVSHNKVDDDSALIALTTIIRDITSSPNHRILPVSSLDKSNYMHRLSNADRQTVSMSSIKSNSSSNYPTISIFNKPSAITYKEILYYYKYHAMADALVASLTSVYLPQHSKYAFSTTSDSNDDSDKYESPIVDLKETKPSRKVRKLLLVSSKAMAVHPNRFVVCVALTTHAMTAYQSTRRLLRPYDSIVTVHVTFPTFDDFVLSIDGADSNMKDLHIQSLVNQCEEAARIVSTNYIAIGCTNLTIYPIPDINELISLYDRMKLLIPMDKEQGWIVYNSYMAKQMLALCCELEGTVLSLGASMYEISRLVRYTLDSVLEAYRPLETMRTPSLSVTALNYIKDRDSSQYNNPVSLFMCCNRDTD